MNELLVDSHCHLDRLDLTQCGGSIDTALERAREQGVGRVLCIAIDTGNIATVVDLAQRYSGVSASAGVHPLHAHECDLSEATLLEWARHDVVVAIGETGLDYYYDQAHRDIQQHCFAQHLRAAASCQLPVIVHTRDAREDTIALIREFGCTESAGVLHCFTEDWDMAAQAMDLNYSISISGIVTFRNADALRDVVRKLPLDRLLLETDAPYLAPIPHRGKGNQPAYVRHVAETVAELKGLSVEALTEATTANYDNLFKGAGPATLERCKEANKP